MAAEADNDIRIFNAYMQEPAGGHSRQRTLDITLGSLAAARCCLDGMQFADRALSFAKPHVRGDVLASALLLHAGLQALLLNVDADAGTSGLSGEHPHIASARLQIDQVAGGILMRMQNSGSA